MTTRVFSASPAVRERVPLLIGLIGPSGSGKTKSALRLAEGIQRVVGGDIYGCDSEARRMLHYADAHKFHHVPFGAPFSPADYLELLRFCESKKAKTVIVDSMSHEHEGPGGVLEMHAQQMTELAAQWRTSEDKVKMAAWIKPKQERQKLINAILQMSCNFIFCFRAKEKSKPAAGGKVLDLGWMPIAGDEFVYEQTVACLLTPNCGGVPSWHPEEVGSKGIVKLPEHFRDIFAKAQPLSQDIGEKLALWAAGGPGNGAGQGASSLRPSSSENPPAARAAGQSLRLTHVGKERERLKWEKAAMWTWLTEAVGTGDPDAMTAQQWEDVCTLLQLQGSEDYEGERAALVGLGRIKR